MASSVDLFALYANWYGSRVGGRLVLNCCITNLSKHPMIVGVSATGLYSFKLLGEGLFETGMMVEVFIQDAMAAWARERLKMLVKTAESWSAQTFSTFSGTLSGPAAFLRFTDLSTRLTSHSCTMSRWVLVASGDSTSAVGRLTSKRAKKRYNSPVYFGIKSSKRWSNCPRWGRGTALNACLMFE